MSGITVVTGDEALDTYFHIVGIGILFYDYILTVTPEIKFVWAHTSSIQWRSKLIFALNRYPPLVINTVLAIFTFSKLTSGVRLLPCEKFALFRQAGVVTTETVTCIVLFLRVWALYKCSRAVLIFMLCVGAVLIASAAWASVGHSIQVIANQEGCHLTMTNKAGIDNAVAWEGLFVFDTIVFSLTILKSLKSTALTRVGNRLSLPALIIRDGAMYFAIMALSNLANIMTFYFAPPILKGVLSTFANSISVVMVSRLIINLYENATTEDELTTNSRPATYIFSMPAFQVEESEEGGTSEHALDELPDIEEVER